MIPTKAEFPEKLEFLFEPKRYKIAYGGRGGAKSWGYARALLILGAQRPLRILCARETQKSIGESVHKLLEDQIAALGFSALYHVEKARIIGVNGTEITFAGLKHNIDNIKSLEAYDIVWVEEAHTVSKASWEKLIPTIRKDGSEIWVSFNPEFEDDDTYQRFVVKPPAPERAFVRKINWRDNPWFPQVLQEEMDELRAKDPDAFNHIYEGCCVNVLAGAIYESELRLADAQQRITSVPYDRTRPVDCFWDLGYGDMTAVWFAQSFNFEYRLIDYLEACGKPIHWYLTQMQSRGYIFGTDWLPWDLGMHAKQMGSGKSIEELMRLAGRKVRITPKMSVADGINAARSIFPQCWFDQARCAEGVRALRTYRYGEVKATGSATREPIHDDSSHGADAFRYFAIGTRPPKKEGDGKRLPVPPPVHQGSYAPFG